eukprot:gene16085-18366_t
MSTFAAIESLESTSTEAIKYLPEAFANADEIVENRRWFHANPELGFEEHKTAAKIVEILKSYGIEEITEGVGRTGVVALIRGKTDGPCIALRADIDALPLQETSQFAYKSQNEGVMHACGHDGHIAGLLGAAKVLNAERDSLCGVIKLIFQPAEEGPGGAKEMIEDGVLEDGRLGPKVDFIYGIHIISFIDLGKIGCQDGPILAANDKFTINVHGKGGHGANPQSTVDAIVEAAAVVTALQTIVSRNHDPLDSGVITCGLINGGYGFNIVADEVKIVGTTRTFSKEAQDIIKKRMGCICCGVAQTFGGEIDMEYEYCYPATVNAYPECTALAKAAAAKIVGAERTNAPQKTTNSEDFSFFLEQRPGCFFFVGGKMPGDIRPHHKSIFDFDERALLVSASVFVQLIRDILGN